MHRFTFSEPGTSQASLVASETSADPEPPVVPRQRPPAVPAVPAAVSSAASTVTDSPRQLLGKYTFRTPGTSQASTVESDAGSRRAASNASGVSSASAVDDEEARERERRCIERHGEAFAAALRRYSDPAVAAPRGAAGTNASAAATASTSDEAGSRVPARPTMYTNTFSTPKSSTASTATTVQDEEVNILLNFII